MNIRFGKLFKSVLLVSHCNGRSYFLSTPMTVGRAYVPNVYCWLHSGEDANLFFYEKCACSVIYIFLTLVVELGFMF